MKKDFENLQGLFDLSNLSENHELCSKKIKKVIANFKIAFPKNVWIDNVVCLRSKMHAFKCEIDSKNKLKSTCKSQSKNKKFEEYQKNSS